MGDSMAEQAERLPSGKSVKTWIEKQRDRKTRGQVLRRTAKAAAATVILPLVVAGAMKAKDVIQSSISDAQASVPPGSHQEISNLPSNEAYEKEVTQDESLWRRGIYIVKLGDTMSSIAERFYSGSMETGSYAFGYTDPVEILRQCNFQDRKRNVLIFPGQQLYLPDLKIPTYGLAVGESIKVGGETMKLLGINHDKDNPDKSFFQFDIGSGVLPVSLEVGYEFAPLPKVWFRVAADLRSMPEYGDGVPERIVLERRK
jgi:hypothetical protein